ncbi:MAG TPA: efflux RND transporter permease subunit [Nevskiaceae bacterium]|nr:efflux RND transporter permease subunit [Nevskiaceae bacterium]
MTAQTVSTGFTRRILKIVEVPIFHWRRQTLAVLIALTAYFAWGTSQLAPDAGWLKMVPKSHPYMETFTKYYRDFGGANTVLIAVHNENGDIYQPDFMETLRQVADEAFYIPGADRARVTSIFSPSILYIEVVEGGLSGENVIPANYAPTPEMMQRIRSNVAKASVIGRLVSEDQTTALVQLELLENDPSSGTMADVAKSGRTPVERARAAWAATAGQSLGERLRAVGAAAAPGNRSSSLDYVKVGDKLEEIRRKFERPGVSIHIVGFAKVVDDMTKASFQVGSLFVVALIAMGLLLWIYTGSLRLAQIVVATSLVSCTWELGLLHLIGFGLDPFAMLVPFLIMAVSVSHGVQYTSAWANEISTRGATPYQASLATFRSLAIPGVVALLTNVAGFSTIYLIDIQIIREMSINAAFGMLGVIVVNKVLLPIVLSFVRLPNPEGFRRAQEKRERIGDAVFRRMAVLTRRGPATVVVVAMVILSAFGASQYRHVQIGDTTEGVPELRPDSRFNRDAAIIAKHFTMGVDHLKVIAESFDDGCVDHGVMSEIDRFSWYMVNQAGVRDVLSLPEPAKIAHAGLNEGRLEAEIIPRQPQTLAQITALVPTTTGFLNATCSAMALFVFTTDHKAQTINALTDAVKHYATDLQQDSRVKFRLASGNIGVMAATNEEVKRNELPVVGWVYGVIILFLFLSFRTLSGVLCVILPLSMVTLLGYAVMVALGIGQKVATLPVLAFACGIGVDYGIYSYSVVAQGLRRGLTLEEAYFQKMRSTGKATLFTGVGLATGVAMWLFSGLQFQRDMGVLLIFGFTANMIGAIVCLPALANFFSGEELKHADKDLSAGAEDAFSEADR